GSRHKSYCRKYPRGRGATCEQLLLHHGCRRRLAQTRSCPASAAHHRRRKTALCRCASAATTPQGNRTPAKRHAELSSMTSKKHGRQGGIVPIYFATYPAPRPHHQACQPKHQLREHHNQCKHNQLQRNKWHHAFV